ncbi:MAG: YqcC family protein [Planctomycetota bacterium]
MNLVPEVPRNEEYFLAMVEGVRAAEPAWRQQLELSLGHPVELTVDFTSLDGRYELVGPFIQQAVCGTLGAVSQVAQDVARGDLLKKAAQCIVITADAPTQDCCVELDAGLMTVRQWLVEGAAERVSEIDAAIRDALYREWVSQSHYGVDPEAEQGDIYRMADRYMQKLETVMRDVGIWPGNPPEGPLEVKGAFGCENMTYGQWLAWVLIPGVRETVAQRGEFPPESQTAAHASREFDGLPGGDTVHDVLCEFDRLIEGWS